MPLARALFAPFCARLLLLLLLAAGSAAARPASLAALDRTEKRKRVEAFEKRGAVEDWPERAWSRAFTHNTRHYAVKTNTRLRVAYYIGELMEMCAATYRELFGYRFGHIPRLTVHAYATPKAYEIEGVQGRYPPGYSQGLFLPDGLGAIHLPYVLVHGRIHPSQVLLHEGTHQFVHQVIHYKIPLPLQKHFTRESRILPSVPIWLNEGLATYMETARYDGERLEVGRVNPVRLRHLQRMLRTDTAPPLAEVLGRRYGQPFGAAHYAMAWGIVYALRHHGEIAKRDEGRRRLVDYIEACKRGFLHSPEWDFRRLYVEDGRLPEDFQKQWNRRIGEASLETFEKIVVGPNRTLAQWGEAWRERMLDLDPRKPYGGTLRAEGALRGGDDAFHR